MSNATLIIHQDTCPDMIKNGYKVPVTWIKDTFLECEELYERIICAEDIVDWDYDVWITVQLDSDPTVTCQVQWSDEAGVMYPARNLEKLKLEQKI